MTENEHADLNDIDELYGFYSHSPMNKRTTGIAVLKIWLISALT